MIKQGHYFNRVWFDHANVRVKRKRKYIPCNQREGFDADKVIYLKPGETGRKPK